MTIAIFKLDDTETPGLAKAKVLGKKVGGDASTVKRLTGFDLWSIEVVEVVQPSTTRKVRPGQQLVVSAKHLIFE